VGLPPRVDELTGHAAALGLRVSIKLYPDGSPVRDAPQLELLEQLRALVHPSFGWRTEVLVGTHGDLRAWDLVLDGTASIGIDAETHLHDIQALQRRLEAKWRDSGVAVIVLLVSGTHHNRSVLREHRRALASTLPLDGREILGALRAGVVPKASGILIL